MNIPLLQRLRDAGGAFVPIAALGPGADRDLRELEAFGFPIERHPYLGVASRGPAGRLCPDQIEWGLGTRTIGRRVAVWRTVGSTNDVAARASASTANDGLVVLAEGQTAGRGRRGRSWSAPEGSAVLMSALVFPPATLDDPAWLTAWGAVAVADVVEDWTGQTARIKWPNDVRVDGRKVAGILVERAGGAVVGIGLNATAGLADFPESLRRSAASLAMLTTRPVDRSEVARDLIRRLDHHYQRGLEQGPEAIDAPWRGRLERLGESVRVETTSGPIVGTLLDAGLRRGLALGPLDGRDAAPRRVAPAEVLAIVGVDDPPARPGG